MGRVTLVLILCAQLVGCASLHIRERDSTGLKVTKGILRIPVAAVTFGFSEIWHSRERMMSSWMGHPESALLLAWGSPQSSISDGEGGRILTYTERRVRVTPGQATTTTTASATAYGYGNYATAYGQGKSHTTYAPARVNEWQVFRRFRLDRSGTIIAYSWNGL